MATNASDEHWREEQIFVQVAEKKGFLSEEDVAAARKHQALLKTIGTPKRLHQILVDKHVLSLDQVQEVLDLQRRIIVACGGCSGVFDVEGQKPGTRFICKRCKTVLTVPKADWVGPMDETLKIREFVPEPEKARVAVEGSTMGGCEIQELIGRGGMGAVYKALQLSLDRPVAVKILSEAVSHDAQYIARFEREAQIVAQLSHPNIVQVHQMGRDERGLYFIIMEFMEGGTISEQMEGPLAEEKVLRYATEAADGLAAAHGEGIMHRDVKPDNLLLDAFGRVKIADFGLARGVEATVQLTGTGAALGTPAYMSPEQGMGWASMDHRADIYSLGAASFTLLAGAYPYDALSPVEMVMKHTHDEIPRIRDRVPTVSPWTDDMIAKAMAKKPEDRFQTAAEFAEEARGILGRISGEEKTARRTAARGRSRPGLAASRSARARRTGGQGSKGDRSTSVIALGAAGLLAMVILLALF
ncbi:MAG: serine/threonine-protein kinase, partial [Planctomycetota bacterium]